MYSFQRWKKKKRMKYLYDEWEVLDKRKRWVGGDTDSFEEFVEGKV